MKVTLKMIDNADKGRVHIENIRDNLAFEYLKEKAKQYSDKNKTLVVIKEKLFDYFVTQVIILGKEDKSRYWLSSLLGNRLCMHLDIDFKTKESYLDDTEGEIKAIFGEEYL